MLNAAMTHVAHKPLPHRHNETVLAQSLDTPHGAVAEHMRARKVDEGLIKAHNTVLSLLEFSLRSHARVIRARAY